MEVKEQINKEKYDNIDESTEIVTSKTEEIFDKEQWAAALKLTSNIQEHNGWEKAIKWYREQLKKK